MSDLAGALVSSRDARPWVPGTVLSVDHASARVTVDVDGVAVSLRRVAAAYRVGDVVAVVRDPATSGAGQYVAGVIGPVASRWAWGEVTDVTGSPTYRLDVDIDGVSYSLPYVSGTYVATDLVAVMLDPASEMGGLVLGLIDNPPDNPTVPDTPSTPVAATSASVGPVPIRPTWSGTYSTDRGSWDSWGTGARSDLYQGDDTTGDGGPLIGLATFGDQIKNLDAETIESIVLTLRSNGAGYTTPLAFTVQGSPHGTQPAGSPSYSGATVTSASVARVGGQTTVSLPASVCEGFRTGAFKGVVIVGTTYGGLFGTSKADGVAAAVTYTKAI